MALHRSSLSGRSRTQGTHGAPSLPCPTPRTGGRGHGRQNGGRQEVGGRWAAAAWRVEGPPGVTETSRTRQGWGPHSITNIPNATELYTSQRVASRERHVHENKLAGKSPHLSLGPSGQGPRRPEGVFPGFGLCRDVKKRGSRSEKRTLRQTTRSDRNLRTRTRDRGFGDWLMRAGRGAGGQGCEAGAGADGPRGLTWAWGAGV